MTSSRTLLLLLAGTMAVAAGFAQSQQKRYRPPPDYVQLGKPDQDEGREILAEFRQKGIAGEYYLEFRLRVMPRRGEDRWLDGRLWAGRSAQGPINRVTLFPGDNDPRPVETRLLIQGGASPALWRWTSDAGGEAAQVGLEALFDPIAGTDLTAFDVSMPFLYWNDFVYEGLRKVRLRPAHAFILYPPAEVAERYPALTGIRVFLDTQFNALVEAEHIGEKGQVLKGMSLLDVKKVGERWLPKNVDFRDNLTRNKTRFTITGAALDRDFAGGLFEAGQLSSDIPPPSGRIERVF